jgi:citrate lyase subunit beta / citryl-CoA lyase
MAEPISDEFLMTPTSIAPQTALFPPHVARSILFVPADRPDRFDKAWACGVDDVILDLEDAVGIAHKEVARTNITNWLSPERRALVRINAADTAWHLEDLSLLGHPGVRGFVVPKAEYLDDELVQACASFGKHLIPLVETAIGFDRALELAGRPGVERLAFGHLDFQVDLGISGDDDALLYFRSQLVLVSRLAGIHPPLEGITIDVSNDSVLRAETLRAKRLGFGGKLCIHPRQVDTVNRIFSPTEQELRWARAVIDAFEGSSGAAIAVDGKLVDRPIVLKAQRILSGGLSGGKND